MGQVDVLVIDDEPHNRSILQTMLLRNAPLIRQVYEAGTVKDGIRIIEDYRPSIVFLDIQMSGETGFDFLQQIDTMHFVTIIVSAHENYALKAFRFNVADYLLKPVIASELKASLEKAIELLSARRSQDQMKEQIIDESSQKYKTSNAFHGITIPTVDGFQVLTPSDIIYCKSLSNYTELILANKRNVISSQTLGYYDEMLQPFGFFRVHRSFLINLAKVVSFKRSEGGFIVMSNGHEVELSRNKKQSFLNIFKP